MKFIYIMIFLLISPVYAYDIYYGDYKEGTFEDYIDVPVVASSQDLKFGILGRVRIARIEGTDKVIFDSRTVVDYSVVESVISAIKYANMTGYDYLISYDIGSKSVSGHSTGAAIALGLLALKSGQSYDSDYVVSGGIDEFGNLLETGGLPIKILPLKGKTLIALGDEYIYEKLNNMVIAVKLEKYAKQKEVILLRLAKINDIKDLVIKQKL